MKSILLLISVASLSITAYLAINMMSAKSLPEAPLVHSELTNNITESHSTSHSASHTKKHSKYLPAKAKPKVPSATKLADLDAQYQALSDNPDYPNLSDRLHEMNTRRTGENFTAEGLISAMNTDRAWETVSEKPVTLPLSQSEIEDGREFLSFDTLKIESLMSGDKLIIPISELSQEYTMIVDSIQHNDGGSLSWYGHIENSLEQTIIITQSDAITIASINLNEGHYTLQAQNGEAWLASSAVLYKQNFSETDEIFPDQHATHTH